MSTQMSTQQLSDQLIFARDDEPLLSLHLVSRGSLVSIEVCGEVDVCTAHLLTELIEHAARDRPSRVVLDMADVSFFCAEGLRALLRARNTVTADGGQLILRAPSPKIWRILTITRTDHLFSLDTSTTTVTA
jgi:anti-sigma B factor antagonist